MRIEYIIATCLIFFLLFSCNPEEDFLTKKESSPEQHTPVPEPDNFVSDIECPARVCLLNKLMSWWHNKYSMKGNDVNRVNLKSNKKMNQIS